MKETLFEFYKPEENELKAAWDAGLFTFDANVLLNLYRYSNKTTQELLSILKLLKDKLWLTNQAAYEYLNNRLGVIHKQKAAYAEIKSSLQKKLDEIYNDLNSHKKHSMIEIESIKRNLERSFKKVNGDIDKLSKTHPTYEPHDSIQNELTTLFNGKTGPAYTKDKLNEVFREAQQRYTEEIPPGFKDKNTKKDAPKQSLYGDVILWRQIIEKAKAESRAIILVTDDLKDDWWEKFKGETQGPRKELLREFYDETGQHIYIYQADKFLEYANRLKIGKTVKQETITEIRAVRLKDEDQQKEARFFSDYLNRYAKSEEYRKILERISSQQSLFKLDTDSIKKIEESLQRYRSLQLQFDHKDFFDTFSPYSQFNGINRKIMERIIELEIAKKDQNNQTTEGETDNSNKSDPEAN